MEQEKQETGQAKFPTKSFQKGRTSPPQSGEKIVQNGGKPEKKEPADAKKCNKSTGEGTLTETIPFLMHRLKRGAVSKETSIRYLIYIKENDPGNSIS